MRFYPWRGLRAKLRIGSHLGHNKLVSEQYRPRSPLDWSNLVESSLVKNYFESSYISEKRILFSPLLCSSEESWRNNLILLLFSLKLFLGSRGYFWNLYDDDVTEFCLGAFCLLWVSGELSSRGFSSKSLSFIFLSISERRMFIIASILVMVR